MINSFKTLFEARERKFQQERLFRGESVDLVAKITTDGVMDNLSGYSISGVYQPVEDDPEQLTYSVDAEIVDGKAIIHWTDENDFGKTAYNVWGLLTKDGKAAYPICWRLNFAPSPSYPIDEISPIVRTIDFDKYDLQNAPWLPLSGGNMEEGAEIGFPISGDTYFTVSKDGFKKVDETVVETEAMSGYCWYSIPDPVPEYEITWVTESEIANWDWTTQGTPPWENQRMRQCGTKPAESHTEKTDVATFSLPDEEGEHTLATREWTEGELSDYTTKTEADGKFLALSGGNVTMGFNLKNVGYNVLSGLNGAIAIGLESSSTGFSTAVGHHAKADARYSVVIGPEAKSSAQNGVAIGNGAQALSANSTAIGSTAYATRENSVGVGNAARANAPKAIQLGIGVNSRENSLQVFDKNVLSGTNLTLNPDRIPYLSSYATQEWVNEQISGFSPITPDDYLTKVEAAETYETKADAAAVSTSLNGRIDDLSSEISSIEIGGDFLPLSGGTLSADGFKWLASDGTTNLLSTNVERGSIALGWNASASGLLGTALGRSSKAEDTAAAALGIASKATGKYSTAIGLSAEANAEAAIALGKEANARNSRSIAIGEEAVAAEARAIQLGKGTNNEVSSFQVYDYQLLDSSGNIPEGRLSSVLTSYAQLSDIQGGGDLSNYLPLSGGNLSGRIYLKQTETQIVGSTCVFVCNQSADPYFGIYENNINVEVTATISVENADQEFLDMLENGEYTGSALSNYTVKAHIAAHEGLNDTTKSTTVTGTVGFGGYYANGEIYIDIDFPEYAADDTNLTINSLVFDDGGGGGPFLYITYTADYQDDSFAQDYIQNSSDWTVETLTEEVTVTEPFVLSSELPDLSAYATKDELSELSNSYVEKHTSEVQTISTPLINLQPLSAFELNAAYGTDAGGYFKSYGTVTINNSNGDKTTLYPARITTERVGGKPRQVAHKPEIVSYQNSTSATYTLAIPYENGTAATKANIDALSSIYTPIGESTDLSSDISYYGAKAYADAIVGDINSILDNINGQVI